MKPDVSVIVSTYNRSKTLGVTIDSLLAQDQSPNYEILIVDNNCTDNTRELVASYAAKSQRIRYVFEKKQGLSHGRNAGIAAAGSDLLAFTDDDVCVDRNWIHNVMTAAAERPGYGIFGGKVLPMWPEAPPSWLTQAHWAPLALVDYGKPQTISSEHRRTLIGANMIIRRRVFDDVGLFSIVYQRVKEGIGSTEDQELQDRYWKAGGLGWFDPSIVVNADIQQERLAKGYHRRWHFAHGRMMARMRDPIVEHSARSIFGVPQYIFREFVSGSSRWLGATVTGKQDLAFLHEINLLFYAGFVRERIAENPGKPVGASEIKDIG